MNKYILLRYFYLVLLVPVFFSCHQNPTVSGEAKLPEKLLIFGIDAAAWNVVDPLIDAGYLPTIQSLADRGMKCRLKTLQPTVSVMLWTTIATGMFPDKHGIDNWLSEGTDTSGQLAITSNLRPHQDQRIHLYTT